MLMKMRKRNSILQALSPVWRVIVKGLKAQNVKTIVVDEAHHLKNEWWQTLTRVKDRLNPVIVGLTATPPYDVSALEWQRYIALNGPVDAEISVPELVEEGDLCPHQDYVFFSIPTREEQDGIVSFRNGIERLFKELKQDTVLVKAIESHAIWQNPLRNLDWIYNNLPMYSACLIFLKGVGKQIPENNLQVIGDSDLQIPVLDYGWMETLLDFYLFKDHERFASYEEHRQMLENKLKRYGAVERKQINLSWNKRITGLLTSSISKLNGIKRIVDFEYDKLQKDLRLVVLSDFIRKEFLVSGHENNLEINKIGVMPIFEKLRRENHSGKKIGVLTGSMVIIPQSAYNAFQEEAARQGISQFTASHLPYDPAYLLVHSAGQLKHDIVHIVTQIFQMGQIQVLIGTKSLLGEGWDAPAINTLILASFVGSFVLSNQMRGRAIRSQQGYAAKTGNIWHMVCLDSTSADGGDDLLLLKRRFRSFVGVSFRDEPSIENGAGRLNLPENLWQQGQIEMINTDMFALAADRQSLLQRWQIALKSGSSLVEEIKIPFSSPRTYKSVKTLYLHKTISNLLASLGFAMVTYLEVFFDAIARGGRHIRNFEDLVVFLVVLTAGGAVVFGRLALKTLRLYVRYRDISKDIQQIGEALLRSLLKEGSIHSPVADLKVEASMDAMGSVYCHLEGGTTYEKSVFIQALEEIVSPIVNPRYVIIRKSSLLKLVRQKDYHAVPEILGRNKNLAEYFNNQWRSLVGNCELVYTRTLQGRQLLLKSRVKALSAQFEPRQIEHVNKWR